MESLLAGDVNQARIVRQSTRGLTGETETMKLAKPIFLLALILGSANAPAEDISMDSATDVSTIYAIDDDRDGRADRMLELEQSDSLA
jgi:hypothetical protein